MADKNWYFGYVLYDIRKAMDLLRIGMSKLDLDVRSDASVIMRCTHGELETLEQNIVERLAREAQHE